MNDVKAIIDRMKEVTSSRRYEDLAEILGVKLTTINNWKKRNSIPEKNILKCVHLTNCDYNWLLTGDKKEVSNSIVGDNSMIVGNNNGNISINTSKFNHKDDVREIIELLEYAPSGFLTIIKEKLLAFKKLSQF